MGSELIREAASGKEGPTAIFPKKTDELGDDFRLLGGIQSSEQIGGMRELGKGLLADPVEDGDGVGIGRIRFDEGSSGERFQKAQGIQNLGHG